MMRIPPALLPLGLAVLLAILPHSARASALSLDGVGDYVTFDGIGLPTGAEPFTIEAWINPTSIPAGGQSGGQITFWGNQTTNEANGLRLRGPTGVRHYFWGNDHDEDLGSDILPDATGENGWHHIAFTFDGGTSQFYWNGAPLGSPRTAIDVDVAVSDNHRIGSRLDAEFFHGFIDEVRIWGKARSAGEIAADYDRGLAGNENDLLAYFDFEGGFQDLAGGDNNGTPVGDSTIDPAVNAPTTVLGPLIESFAAIPPAIFEGQTTNLTWDIDTANVRGSLLVEILGPGGQVLHSAATTAGSFAVAAADTGGVPVSQTYTLRAAETGGDLISREASADVELAPGIPVAQSQTRQTSGTSSLGIVLTGSDPNAHPNPQLAFDLVSNPAGTLSGTPPNLTYEAPSNFVGADSFEFRVNDGKYTSAPATVTVNVVPSPTPPTDITLSSTTIADSVVDGGFIAEISSTDPNPGETHRYALVTGAGSTDNGLFRIVGDELRGASSFTGQVGMTFSIRVRSTDSGSLSFEKRFELEVVRAVEGIVINEIHYNPPENTVRQEFIELFNPGETEADLSGWRLSGAVRYVFPDDTKIPAGGFLVIGEDPPTLESTFRISALGPYDGNLDSDGETVRLRNQNDVVVDLADYRTGFPWPTAADGGGASIELIHHTLDNSLGSSWRASIPENGVLLNFADSNWSWRPGETEASVPIDAWRSPGFTEDGSWFSGIRTPLGYGTINGSTQNTIVNGMQGGYTCVFLRNSFTIQPGTVPSQLNLNYVYDDGFVLWINGVEVERKRFPAGESPTIDSVAETAANEGVIESKVITDAQDIFVEGENTIAVQVFNRTIDSADLIFDLEIAPPEAGPTPGRLNLSLASNAPPNIRKVNHTPQEPTAADQTVITALVTDPDGVASVEVEYQVVEPGDYLPARLPFDAPNLPADEPLQDNPDYHDPANWTAMPMRDDGTGGDEVAGDGYFSATLPAQAHRTLVRYRITVEDQTGLSIRVPYADDPSLNFAYFVYDGVPEYNGHSVETMTSLPVYHVITRGEDWDECIAYDGAEQIAQGSPNPARFVYNWPGTIVYDGEVYDNIRYRLRGANGRYHARGKRSMRFRLNKGRYFQARDQFGNKYSRKWRTLTTGKCFGNRQNLSYSLNEAVTMYLYNKVGVPAADTHWVHWRVIDNPRETDQYFGDFHGIYFIIETYDVRFMESHDMEKGNLYKLINSTRSWEKQMRYQAPFAVNDGADHDFIENSLSGNDSADTIRAHVNLEKWYWNHAMVEAVRHYDYWPSANKNMVYYFEPDYLPENRRYGKLWILPWDTDATWGPTYNSGHDAVYNALFPASGGGADSGRTPELWPEYFNTIRELRDLVWQRDQINGVLQEFASYIKPLEQADRDRWQNAPANAGNYGGLVGAGLQSIDALVQDMNNFAFSGGSWPGGGVGQGGRAAYLDTRQGAQGEGDLLPEKPGLRYIGDPEFVTNGIVFQTSPFRDPQGDSTFGAMEYRLAEITDPTAPGYDPTERFKLEINAVWESGILTEFARTIDIPTAVLRSGRTYRARVRHQDNTGRWSHWSDAFEFTTTLPDLSQFLSGLVISEFMYHPTDPTAAEFAAGHTNDDDFEWIELRNVGPSTLNLTDLRFTKGVDFSFLNADITSLAPGEFVLVVANRAAFEMRYGTGLPIAGEWERGDRLDNGGERLKLSFGGGDPVRDLDYDDVPPWPVGPDGGGTSLTLISPHSLPNHGLSSSWRASFAIQGTPGASETTGGFASWLDDQDEPDPLAPFADSSLSNLLAYGVGADLTPAPEDALPFLSFVDAGGEAHPALSYRSRLDGTDLTYLVEVSDDLINWKSGDAFTAQLGPPTDNGDGTVTVTVRSLQSLSADPQQFMRLRVTVAP